MEKLNEKEIETIVNALEENISDNTKILRNIQETTEEIPEAEPTLQPVEMINGNKTILPTLEESDKDPVVGISDILDNTAEVKLAEATESSMKTVLEDLGLEDEKEIFEFIKVINKFKKGEKVYYMELPKMVKSMVDTLYQTSPKGSNKQTIVNDILKFFINEMTFEQEFIDFQDALNKEMEALPDFMEIYTDHMKDAMEVELIKAADKLEETDPSAANKLRAISNAFIESYTFKLMIDAFENNDKITRRLDKELSKYNHYLRSFKIKYDNHKFSITDPSLVIDTLLRKTDYTEDEIKEFLILFFKISMNFSPDIISEHAYMYYTLKNIISLDFLDEESEFAGELYNNLNKVFKFIQEVN